MEILERLNEMAGFAPNEEIQLYEVLVDWTVYVDLVFCLFSVTFLRQMCYSKSYWSWDGFQSFY